MELLSHPFALTDGAMSEFIICKENLFKMPSRSITTFVTRTSIDDARFVICCMPDVNDDTLEYVQGNSVVFKRFENLKPNHIIQVEFTHNCRHFKIRVRELLHKDNIWEFSDWDVRTTPHPNEPYANLVVARVTVDQMAVLDELAFIHYALSEKKLFRPSKLCGICYENNFSQQMHTYSCFHTTCKVCDKKMEQNPNCYICSQEIQGRTRLIFRDGPCPLDNCDPDADETQYCLLPCCCVLVHSGKLPSEGLENCPYSTCGRRVSKICKIYR